MAKLKLTDKDWELLFPSETYIIGKTSLSIRPLNISEVSKLLKSLNDCHDDFKKANITKNNYYEPSQLMVLSEILLDKAADLISDSTNLDIEDVKNLPLNVAVDLIKKLIEVNIENKDGLLKNLKALGETITRITSGE